MALSLKDQFIEWLRTKDAEEKYPAGDPWCCALAQFGKPGLVLGNLEENGVPTGMYDAALGRPHTFAALLERMEASK